MNIDTQSVIRYINLQIQVFSLLTSLKSEFNDGLKEGFNIVKTYIEMYEMQESKEIAKQAGEK